MMKILYSSNRNLNVILLGDVFLVFVSIILSYVIKFYLEGSLSLNIILSRLDFWVILVVGLHIFSIYLFDLYNQENFYNKVRLSIFITLSVLFAGILISGIFYFFPKYVLGRKVFLIHILMTSFLLIGWRVIAAGNVVRGMKPRLLAIIGNAVTVRSFLKELIDIRNFGYKVGAVCLVGPSAGAEEAMPAGLKSYGSLDDLLGHERVDALAFESSRWILSDDEVRRILDLQNKGLELFDLPSLYKSMTGKVPLSYIDGKWLLASGIHREGIGEFYLRLKRVLDFFLALSFLVLTLPLQGLIALAVRLDSSGAVLFVQERLGEDKVPFDLVKFRTMVRDAEGMNGPQWASEQDPRITRVGKVLRRTRLDELPQLWNILKGDMSFVGPRPIRDFFARELEKDVPFYDLRFGVKPGLTGWAQVNHAYAGSVQEQVEKFQYELFYLQNMSFLLDLYIIVKTIKTVLFGKGGQ